MCSSGFSARGSLLEASATRRSSPWYWPGNPHGSKNQAADTPGMVRINTRWVQELEQYGNEPGLNQGDVVIELGTPIDGMEKITVASDKVSFGAEAGTVVGVSVELDDGRHLFVPWANVTGFIDAPAAGKKRKG